MPPASGRRRVSGKGNPGNGQIRDRAWVAEASWLGARRRRELKCPLDQVKRRRPEMARHAFSSGMIMRSGSHRYSTIWKKKDIPWLNRTPALEELDQTLIQKAVGGSLAARHSRATQLHQQFPLVKSRAKGGKSPADGNETSSFIPLLPLPDAPPLTGNGRSVGLGWAVAMRRKDTGWAGKTLNRGEPADMRL